MRLFKSPVRAIYGIVVLMIVSSTACTDLSQRPDDKSLDAGQQLYDLVIRNGRVMDPESGLDGIRNVGIVDGKIASVTQNTLSGKSVIDATGLIVSPGFIDLHAHNINPTTSRLHAQDGVTSVFDMESGAFPIDLWYAERKNTPINIGVAVSHIVIRALTFNAIDRDQLTGDNYSDAALLNPDIDWFSQPSTLTQRQQMAALLNEGLEQGGLGFGFHLATTTGADVNEMLYFYRLSAEKNVTNFVHIRSVGQVSPIQAGSEVVNAAVATGANIHVVHINSSGLWQTKELLALLSAAQNNGLGITTEVYPYTGAESSLSDPRVEQGLSLFNADYSDLELVATGERLTKESFEYHKKNTPNGMLVAHIMEQENIDAAVVHPMVMIGSDGGDYPDGKGHPRGTGSFARVLGYYVREKKALSLMQALRKVSLMPAQVLERFVPQMKIRGRLQVGMAADITIFDQHTIADQATYKEAMLPSKGIAYVIVNGERVVDNYQFLEGRFPGKAIRR